MVLFVVLGFLGIETIFIILNKPIRKRWEAQVGKVISWRQVKQLTERNKLEWILIAAPKTPGSSSFGTYRNFGGGWDAIILLNTHSSERFVVRGRWRKIERFAERANVPTLS